MILAITGFATKGIWDTLLVYDDIQATINTITTNENLFRLGILCNILMTLSWVITALFLYKYFVSISKINSLLMFSLVLLGGAVTLGNALMKIAALELLNNAYYVSAFSTEQMNAIAMMVLEISKFGEYFAYIFFGLWLLPLAVLLYKYKSTPKMISVLLSILVAIAGFGYLADSTIFLFDLPINTEITQFTFWGEVFLLIWLLVKGVEVHD